MKSMPKFLQSWPARSLLVALAITGAAAAVASAVVSVEAPFHAVPRATALPEGLARVDALAMEQRNGTRSPKDAGRRIDPPWQKPAAMHAAAPGDASLPSAADALGAEGGAAEEPAPSF